MTKSKSLFLLFLRICIGWHLLYEGLDKLFTPGWSAAGYLRGSYGFLSGLFHSLAVHPDVLRVVDFINIWGLILIGTGLFLGLFIRVSAASGLVLLAMYYLAYPPFGSAAFSLNQEGHYWIINRNFIECISLGVVYFFPVMDYSLMNLFKQYRLKVKEETVPKSEMTTNDTFKRRELIKGLISLPFYGGVIYSSAKAVSMARPDASTGATTALKTHNLGDLKGTLPKGKIGNKEFSRLIMGCNLIGGYSHSRDLSYVSSLFRHYNTERKIFETWGLAEQSGINTTNLTVEMYPFFNRYKKSTGSNMNSIAQILVNGLSSTNPDKLVNFKKAVDQGATSIYIQGVNGDFLVKANRLDLIQDALDYVKGQGLLAGVGAHSIEVCIACDKAGMKPDYYFKTMHHDHYWSASPREFRTEFGLNHKVSDDHNSIHDNIWDFFPEKTVDFFSKSEVPLIGFKVMAAGAISPKVGFKYAFENGADFICVGMFDFQVIEDVNIAIETLSGVLNRKRPWFA